MLSAFTPSHEPKYLDECWESLRLQGTPPGSVPSGAECQRPTVMEPGSETRSAWQKTATGEG
jgi:hypothetical protein